MHFAMIIKLSPKFKVDLSFLRSLNRTFIKFGVNWFMFASPIENDHPNSLNNFTRLQLRNELIEMSLMPNFASTFYRSCNGFLESG